jgi:hypothetical protein
VKLINGNKAWSKKDEAELLQLIHAKTPMHIMRVRLGRTAGAIFGRLTKIKNERKSPLMVLSVKD